MGNAILSAIGPETLNRWLRHLHAGHPLHDIRHIERERPYAAVKIHQMMNRLPAAEFPGNRVELFSLLGVGLEKCVGVDLERQISNFIDDKSREIGRASCREG